VPNILFIGIDSFRGDKFYGKKKSSKTPNIDKLLQNGVYFDQHISVSDGSYTCMGAIFTSLYPFQSGITTVSAYSKSTKIFDNFRKLGYGLYGTAPCTPFFINLIDGFDEKENFPKPGYLYTASEYEKVGRTGHLIMDRLERIANKEIKEPWFYFIFLTDLHRSVKYGIPKEYYKDEYGETDYDRMVSALDVWLGKFIEKIDLSNTLIVITADHGDFVPTPKIGHEMTYIPSLFEPGSKIKKKLPKFLHGIIGQTYRLLRYFIIPIRNRKLEKNLSPLEFRSLNTRGHKTLWILPDDTVRVPLLIAGCGINSKNKIISQQVRSIDIMPTIADIIHMPFDYDKVEGRSLVPLIEGKELPDASIFIENAVRRNPTRPGNAIGLRTSQYKYYRARNDPKKKVALYDLKNDPDEIENIAHKKPDVINELEKLLTEVRKHSISDEEIDKEETKRIEELLKPFGPPG